MKIDELEMLSKNELNIIDEVFTSLFEFTGQNSFLDKIPKSYFIDPASVKYHGCHEKGLLLHSCNVAIGTYKNLKIMREMKINNYLNNLTDEEFLQYLKDGVFAGLFHDFCKVGNYLSEEIATDKQIQFIKDLNKIFNIKFDYIDLGKDNAKIIIDTLLNLKTEMNNNSITPERYESITSYVTTLKRGYSYKDEFQIGHGEKSVILLLLLGVKLSQHQIYAIYNHMNEMDVKWQLDIERTRILIHTDKIPMQKAIILAEKQSGFLYEIGKEYL